ncbi:putative small-conductance mechanosensitive ion channel [Candidatus Nitrososphaera gargensis Ga9.2]|uniref:Putative small-conductance mechanosensitive ion channel n=1 Tax=Nitrososphaera gargensis (strain Ga9.2) TaxID=1237085 RepID=K0IC55_NITGG|nr:putative small-conductance mechanosensitive ion channel [Candidatus Nitrososphaera gargensis Ga9.2]
MVTTIDQLVILMQENNILFSILVIGGTVLGIKLLGFVFQKIVNALDRHEHLRQLDSRLIYAIRIPLYLGVALTGLRIALTQVPFLDSYSSILDQIFYVGSLVLIAAIILKVIDVIGLVTSRSWFKRTRANVSSLILPMSRLGKGLTVFLIGAAALAVFGVDVTDILFGWGLLGFAIVVALQPIILDVFAGLSIASQGSLRVGQRIILSSGELVEVKEIRLQNTLFRDVLTGNIYSISNADLMKQKITILEKGVLPVPIAFKVGYDDVQMAYNIAMQIGTDLRRYLAKDPVVNIRELNDNNKAKLELLLWISDASNKDNVVTQVLTKLINALRRNAIVTEQKQS